MTTEVKKTLSELKVNELKAELEKRSLDKNGVKMTLLERLEQALKDEGQDASTYQFTFQEGGRKSAARKPGEPSASPSTTKTSSEATDPATVEAQDQTFADTDATAAVADTKKQNGDHITQPEAPVNGREKAAEPLSQSADAENPAAVEENGHHGRELGNAAESSAETEAAKCDTAQQASEEPDGDASAAADAMEELEETENLEQDEEEPEEENAITDEKKDAASAEDKADETTEQATQQIESQAVPVETTVSQPPPAASEDKEATGAAVEKPVAEQSTEISIEKEPSKAAASECKAEAAATIATQSEPADESEQRKGQPSKPVEESASVAVIVPTATTPSEPLSQAATTISNEAASQDSTQKTAVTESANAAVTEDKRATQPVKDTTEEKKPEEPKAGQLVAPGSEAVVAASTKPQPAPVKLAATTMAVVDDDGKQSVWVKGISNSTKAADLKHLFTKFGRVIAAKIFTTKNKQTPSCFGYITMSDVASADLAVEKLFKTNFKGKVITLEKGNESTLPAMKTKIPIPATASPAASKSTAATSTTAASKPASANAASPAKAKPTTAQAEKEVITVDSKETTPTGTAAKDSSKSAEAKKPPVTAPKKGAKAPGGNAKTNKPTPTSRNALQRVSAVARRKAIATSRSAIRGVARGGVTKRYQQPAGRVYPIASGSHPPVFVGGRPVPLNDASVFSRVGHVSSYGSRVRPTVSTRTPLIRQRPNIPPPPEPPVRYFAGAQQPIHGSGRPGDKRRSDDYRRYSPGRHESSSSRHREPSPKRHRSSSSRHHGVSSLERMDKEDLVRLMRRREEEHKQREKERELEREKARLRAERERLEREKLEIQQLKLTAQLASVQQHFLQQAAQPAIPPLAAVVGALPVQQNMGASRAAAASVDAHSRREHDRVKEKERGRAAAPPPSSHERSNERYRPAGRSTSSHRSRSPRSVLDKSRGPPASARTGRSPARQPYGGDSRDNRSSRDRDGRLAATRDSRAPARDEAPRRREPLIRDAPYGRAAPPVKTSQPSREPPVIYLDEDQPSAGARHGATAATASGRSPARAGDRGGGRSALDSSRDTRRTEVRSTRDDLAASRILDAYSRRAGTPPYASRTDPSYASRVAGLAAAVGGSSTARDADVRGTGSYGTAGRGTTASDYLARSLINRVASEVERYTDTSYRDSSSYGSRGATDGQWSGTGSGTYASRGREETSRYANPGVSNAVWPPTDSAYGASSSGGNEWSIFGTSQPSNSGRYDSSSTYDKYRRY